MHGTEQELRARRRFIEAIAASVGDGVYAIDSRGRVTFMNRAAEKALGWKESELLGREMHAVIHFQRSDHTSFPVQECPILSAQETDRTVAVASDVFTRRDGGMFPVSYTSSPILIEGLREGSVIAFRDASARKEAEDALRENEDRYRLFLDGIPTPLYVLDPHTLRFEAANQAALELYGYTRDEFLAMNLRDIHLSHGPNGFTGALPDWCLGPRVPTPAQHRTKRRGPISVETVAGSVQIDRRNAYVVLVNEVAPHNRLTSAAG